MELLETRHVRTAFKIMPVKTDRKDARGIAQLMRLGWFRPVHCKSLAAQETRAVLGARKLLQIKLHDIEMSLRGTLRGFGLKVGKTTPKTFESRVRSLVADHPTLLAVSDALLRARTVLAEQFKRLDNQAHRAARADKRARLLTTAPGVGSIVALTFAVGDRRSQPVQIVQECGTAVRTDPKTIPVRGDGRNRADLEGWRRDGAHRALRSRQCHSDAHGRGLASAKVGPGGGPARGDAQGQSGAGTQAGGDPAPDVGGWHPVRRCQGRRGGITEGGINRFGRPVRVVRSRVPSPGRRIRSGRITCSGAAWLIARH